MDLNGKILAHGAKAGLLGRSMEEIREPDEKYFLWELVTIAKAKGAGTVDYKWENPQSLVVEMKTAIFEKADGVVLGCGFYKAYPWQKHRH